MNQAPTPTQPGAMDLLSHVWGWLVGGGLTVAGALWAGLRWLVRAELDRSERLGMLAARVDAHEKDVQAHAAVVAARVEVHEKDAHAHANHARFETLEKKLDDIRDILSDVREHLAAATGKPLEERR